jgi:hypothetical protein
MSLLETCRGKQAKHAFADAHGLVANLLMWLMGAKAKSASISLLQSRVLLWHQSSVTQKKIFHMLLY